MKLYYAPGACSQAPHIVLRETGLPFELEKVDIPAKRTESGADYWQINAKGYVPALALDNGDVLTEVGVICLYIADQKPDSGLAPREGTLARYHLMEWINFVATEVHKQLGALFNPKWTAEMRDVQMGVIHRRLNSLEKMLAGKQYLMGDTFSVADAYLFNVYTWTRVHQIDTAKWPGINALVARVAARPSVKAALKAEGLTK